MKLSAEHWNELLEKRWEGDGDNAIHLYYTLHYKEGRRLAMLKEALDKKLDYLFAAMIDPAYVPRVPKVMELLERELRSVFRAATIHSTHNVPAGVLHAKVTRCDARRPGVLEQADRDAGRCG